MEMTAIFKIGLGGTGYAGISSETWNISRIWQTFLILSDQGVLWISLIGLIVLMVSTLSQKQLLAKSLILLFLVLIIFITGVVPQILLYSKSQWGGYWAGHYLLPALLGCSFLAVFTLFLLKQSTSNPFLRIVFLTIIAVVVLNKTAWSWNQSVSYALEGKATNSLLGKIEKCVSNNDILVIVVNPRVHYEAAMSFNRYLRYGVKRDQLFVATYGTEKTMFLSSSFEQEEEYWKFLNPKEIEIFYQSKTLPSIKDKKQIKAILILNPDKLNPDFFRTNKDWFFYPNYQHDHFEVRPGFTADFFCHK